jgi:hypothetical protein
VEGLEADDRVGVGLRLGGEEGADGEVVDGEGLGGGELAGVVGGEADQRCRAQDGAGFDGGKVGLAEVEAEAKKGSVVGPVIENEISFSLRAGLEGCYEVSREVAFVADLNPMGSAVEGSLETIDEIVPVQVSRVEDRVEHYSWMGA